MSTIHCDIGGAKHSHIIEVLPGARKRPVGSARRAICALHAARDRRAEKELGMRFIGEGIAKTCYTDGAIVYKVPLEYEGCTCESCIGEGEPSPDEYQHWQEYELANGGYWDDVLETKVDISKRPRWASPTSAYIVDGTCVLTQPVVTPMDNVRYTDARYSSIKKQLDKALQERRSILGDMHPGNYGVAKNGHLRIFDLGA
jgi:hypothetical protein